MKIRIHQNFIRKLARQVAYITKDKPLAARKFKSDILSQLKLLHNYPYRNKKSIYFDSKEIRGLIFKG